MTERQYQAKITRRLRSMFPECVLLKNDASYQQGIPDWIILVGDKWAALEIKASAKAPTQPNQKFFVQHLDDLSFAAIIYPENEAEVLRALQEALEP